jgi:ubiquinone/menaquinone biosynthesis C-methylase UbiE
VTPVKQSEHSKQVDHLEATRRYYDEFAGRYDDRRGGRVPGGYHDLVDELELEFLERFARDKSVLEVGCGTGLLLERMHFASSARGVDISPGMLDKARERSLDVHEGSATALPFDDESFDAVCSFKVLAHVREIRGALREMLRVTRVGGTVVAEFYNPRSLRALVKRFGPAGAISASTNEDAVYTRFDSPEQVRAMLPDGARVIDERGVRIVTPAAKALRLPLLGPLLYRAEHALCDTPLARLAGFWIAAIRKAR